MALTRSRATTAPLAHPAPPSPPMSSVSIPIRFQCPLCLDVLRRPIQLPCCQRYLCMECFERGLELTSVNCGFCRRRVVGFARTKQYKVDEAMWTAIKTQCPFLGDIADDREPLVEFFDENAPPLHNGSEDHPTTSDESSGELKAFYERQLLEHQSQVQEAEQRALEQTIEFLENDLEFTASLAASPASSTSSSSSPGPTLSGAKKKLKVAATPRTTRSSSHRPLTRSLSTVDDKQPKLDNFFASSRASSSHSGLSLGRAHSTNVGLSSPRARTHLKIDEPHRKYFLRSASHSPTPTKQRRRQPVKGRKPLLQLTLDTTISPIALHTRSRDLKRANSVDSESEPTKMLTRQGRRRSSWKCVECTYTNTCFDSRCSMCRCLPPPEAFTSLSSH
ncbi:hypothetical protein JG687_00002903 [Phytophthora cactorum]|nr:hypothetical protein Pcac1_g13886 [Phytophthora cactorum]KAG2946482.1 hypothetical protein PC117_g7604 [Phytophthora cactorum]KAG3017062.1 hypothetical protein PC120_g11253 [Phytophthora cactorum]KAG3027654.1 hypothetical protein PC119_g7295 [Phytophthora cactorum]KAG3064014.1 hypothetical protein PC121_g11908 [Phytophthora cactorum]